MITWRTATTAATLAAAAGITLTGAAPATAGGVGDFLSPAFGTDCANHHGTRAAGTTTHGTGTANGNLAGLPVGSLLNQCGGADLPQALPAGDLGVQGLLEGGLLSVGGIFDGLPVNKLPVAG